MVGWVLAGYVPAFVGEIDRLNLDRIPLWHTLQMRKVTRLARGWCGAGARPKWKPLLILPCFADTTKRSEHSLLPLFLQKMLALAKHLNMLGAFLPKNSSVYMFHPTSLEKKSALRNVRLHPRSVQRIDNQQSHAGTNPQVLRSYQRGFRKIQRILRAHVSPSMLSPSVVIHRTANA